MLNFLRKKRYIVSPGTGDFVRTRSTSYIFVKVLSSAVANGTSLLAAIAAAKVSTPYGQALSETNRIAIQILSAHYDIGINSISLGEFIDIECISHAKNAIITSSNATGTFLIEDANNYILKNLTVNNTGSGGSITHNAGQTDTGIWENITLSAPTTNGTEFNGHYNYINGTSDHILNGDITGTVSNSTFAAFSCGYNSVADLTISGAIFNCIATTDSFGSGNAGVDITSTATISDSTADSNSFGYGNTTVTISGIIKNCSGGAYCFGISVSVIISGIITRCITTSGTYSFGYGNNVTISGIIEYCKASSIGFGIGAITMSGTIRNCISTTNSFAYGDNNPVTISGIIEYCTSGVFSFGSVNAAHDVNITSTARILNCNASNSSFGHSDGGVVTNDGLMENCKAALSSFGNSSSLAILRACIRTSGYGTHSGTIERCSFSENDSIPTLTLGEGAIVKYSTIYQQGSGECIDATGPINASVYFNAINKAPSGNITNSIAVPLNVTDSNIIL